MTLRKFGQDDIFYNRIKTFPKQEFLIYDAHTYHNGKVNMSGKLATNIEHVTQGHINLHEINVDRPATSLVYPFIYKGGSREAFKTITTKFFNDQSVFEFGDQITGSYPLSASVTRVFYTSGTDIDASGNLDKPFIVSLKNTLNWYTHLSPEYAYSSSEWGWRKGRDPLNLISIPSIFYGSSIRKGSVDLKFYVSGTLVGQLQDKNRNGELIETTGSNTDEVAGVVLYNEGFILLTGSWVLNSAHTEAYTGAGGLNPTWLYFGAGLQNDNITGLISSSYVLAFEGVNYIPTVTMFAHASAGEFNNSNNPTFVSGNQRLLRATGSTGYFENEKQTIKNTVASVYNDPTGSFQRQVWISRVAIYDEDKNVIGIAKLARPVKKRESDSLTVKMKLDF